MKSYTWFLCICICCAVSADAALDPYFFQHFPQSQAQSTIMPERRGYTSFHGDPVDRHGRPEHYSGRINHQHMNAYANRDSLNFDNFARHHANELYSTTSTDFENIPPREHPYRSEPSQISERRARGYNPAWQGSVRSSGSSPQIHDEGYAGKPMPALCHMRV